MFEILYPNHPKPSQSFLTWLIGFTEGDGSFIIIKRVGLQFVISASGCGALIVIQIYKFCTIFLKI